ACLIKLNEVFLLFDGESGTGLIDAQDIVLISSAVISLQAPERL
ncbi:MAG: hypothetical protein H6Q48_2074, partial [Deltaproteobacteria bacterium]|nr:hypothetical protein [Deltaproteobacteria bacterium]